MLLRRVIKHVEDQNWLAIGIDFFIVVSGVFLGLQLGNWNDARADRHAYGQAIERYITEANTNLERLDSYDAAYASVLAKVGQAIDALQSCENTPENNAILDLGLQRAVGTFGLALQTSTLDELTSSPRMIAQQSLETRQRFSDTKFRTDLFLREADAIEEIPIRTPLQSLPVLTIGPLENRESIYGGVDYSRPQRPLQLAVPFEEACKDQALIKALFTWERWQGALPAVSRILRADLEANLKALEEK